MGVGHRLVELVLSPVIGQRPTAGALARILGLELVLKLRRQRTQAVKFLAAVAAHLGGLLLIVGNDETSAFVSGRLGETLLSALSRL